MAGSSPFMVACGIFAIIGAGGIVLNWISGTGGALFIFERNSHVSFDLYGLDGND